MSGQDLKNKLDKLGIQYTKLADQLGMSQPNFSASFKVADIKTGFLEKICDALNLPITYFYDIQPEIVNTAVSGNNNAVASNNSTATSGTNDDIVKQLLDEVKALRQQNERLTNKLLES